MQTDDDDRTRSSLLAKVRNLDDQEAWARFYQFYRPLIFKWAKGTGLSASDADEMTQVVMLKMTEKLPTFAYDPSKGFRAWLRTVVIHQSIDVFRKAKKENLAIQQWLERISAPDDLSVDSLIDELNPQLEHDRELATRALAEVRASVDASTWSTFVLTVINEMAVPEVARELGLTIASVYVNKGRVLKSLKQVVERFEKESSEVAP